MRKINSKDELEKVLGSNEKCVVKIGSECCGTCKVVESTLGVIENEFADVTFVSVDAEEADDIVDMFSVRNIPTLVFVKNGDVVEKVTGLRTKEQITEIIKKF